MTTARLRLSTRDGSVLGIVDLHELVEGDMHFTARGILVQPMVSSELRARFDAYFAAVNGVSFGVADEIQQALDHDYGFLLDNASGTQFPVTHLSIDTEAGFEFLIATQLSAELRRHIATKE